MKPAPPVTSTVIDFLTCYSYLKPLRTIVSVSISDSGSISKTRLRFTGSATQQIEPVPDLSVSWWSRVYHVVFEIEILVPPARFQRATFRLGGGRSMQLSYGSTSVNSKS